MYWSCLLPMTPPQNSGSSNTTWLFCVFKNEVNSAFQVGMRAYLKLYWLGRLSQHWTCLYFIVCANVDVAGIFNFKMQVIFTGFWNHSYKRLVTWNTQWTDFNRLNVIVNCLLKCYYAKAHDHAVVMYIIFCSLFYFRISIKQFKKYGMLNGWHVDNLIWCSWLTIFTPIF